MSTQTFRTRKTIKLNSKDLFLAADIAKNAIPAYGDLKETVRRSKGGKEPAYCIAGCVAQAVSSRRHIGFRKAADLLFLDSSSNEVNEAEFMESLAQKLDVPANGAKGSKDFNLVRFNDDVANAPNVTDFKTLEEMHQKFGKKHIKRAREWQVRTLKSLAKKLAKTEAK